MQPIQDSDRQSSSRVQGKNAGTRQQA